MATMQDLVTRAYRKLGVGGLGEEINAEQSAEGIDALNSMLHEWKLSGVDITHSDLTMADAFPLGPEYKDGTVYMLAARLSPDFEAPQNFDADDFFRKIQAAYFTVDPVTFDAALTQPPSRKAREGT